MEQAGRLERRKVLRVTPEQLYLAAFVDQIKRVRKQRKLSRRALAEMAGTHRNTVDRLEAGHMVRLDTALSVVRVLGIVWYFTSYGATDAITVDPQLIEPHSNTNPR